MDIQGKTALVTGGAHRVGKAICLHLAKGGANVAFTYHSSHDEADATERELSQLGIDALAVQYDIEDWTAVQDTAKRVQANLGDVDILVNSAGLFERTSFPTDDIESWRRITRVSIDGTFQVCNALAPGMLARGSGIIINILDSAAQRAWPNYTAHAVAKSGMLALTRQLALELSPTVRTNAVLAGPVLPAPDMSEAAIARIASETLLKRWGSPEDVAKAVQFLIESDYIIGEVLTVDGGEQYA